MRIRRAEPTDADRLIEFNLRMARETEGRQLDPQLLSPGVKAVLADLKLGFYLVAEVDGEVVGSLMVTTEWSDWRNGTFWWIQSVYVAPEFRGQGVFRALYADIKARARNDRSVCGCRLYVERNNTSAQTVYTRLGFEETKYRMYEDLTASSHDQC